eukprot:Hpha_TRINITY_DN15231_c1_g13::TRINITY_DN15231_c1_g13_i1::g.67651::m.67651/K07507/mgtC; putative Mg2+ transporter-C (MgtC) family protein
MLRSYFTDPTPSKYVGYTGLALLLITTGLVVLLEPFVNPDRCDPDASFYKVAQHLGGNDLRPNQTLPPIPLRGMDGVRVQEEEVQLMGGSRKGPAKMVHPNRRLSSLRKERRAELQGQEDWPCWNINHYAGDDPDITAEERGTLYYWCSQYPNPEYKRDPCLWERRAVLMGLTQLECQWGRRLMLAGFFGAMVGYERRPEDRPVGIRNMVLVSTASALLTLIAVWGFISGPFEWDSSRVSAALPSGVGFLGAGVIWKDKNQVHGLTTAAGTWLSCAIGVAAGGGLYFNAFFVTVGFTTLVRFGPRPLQKDEEFDEDAEEEEEEGGHGESSSGVPTERQGSVQHLGSIQHMGKTPRLQRLESLQQEFPHAATAPEPPTAPIGTEAAAAAERQPTPTAEGRQPTPTGEGQKRPTLRPRGGSTIKASQRVQFAG